MKNNPALPGGALKSKPTWSNASGVPPRRLFCFLWCKTFEIHPWKATMPVAMEVSYLATAHDRKRHSMSASLDLYCDFLRKGGIPFRTVPARHPSDCDFRPKGSLSYGHLDVGMNGDVIVVRLGKHRVLDELTVNKISEELLGVADRPDCHRLLLDFSGVAQLSSAMLARLVMLHRKMDIHGEKLRLCGLDSQLRSVFATTKLDRLFDITDTEAGAVALQSPPFAEQAV